jgi:hypothetical protein
MFVRGFRYHGAYVNAFYSTRMLQVNQSSGSNSSAGRLESLQEQHPPKKHSSFPVHQYPVPIHQGTLVQPRSRLLTFLVSRLLGFAVCSSLPQQLLVDLSQSTHVLHQCYSEHTVCSTPHNRTPGGSASPTICHMSTEESPTTSNQVGDIKVVLQAVP